MTTVKAHTSSKLTSYTVSWSQLDLSQRSFYITDVLFGWTWPARDNASAKFVIDSNWFHVIGNHSEITDICCKYNASRCRN